MGVDDSHFPHNNMNKVLVTLTGPSAAGKTHLFDFGKKTEPPLNTLVATTTRAARDGEMHGKSYYFTTKENFCAIGDQGGLVEKNLFNGEYYGMTTEEFFSKLNKGPAFAIVDPNGVNYYEQYCKSHKIEHVKVFITVSFQERVNRFITRFRNDILTSDIYAVSSTALNHIKRLQFMCEHEEKWILQKSWDLVLNGSTNPEENLRIIYDYIEKLEPVY